MRYDIQLFTVTEDSLSINNKKGSLYQGGNTNHQSSETDNTKAHKEQATTKRRT